MATLSGLRTRISIGAVLADRAPRILINSERHRPLSRAVVELPDAHGQLVQSIAIGQPVKLSFGYRDQPAGVWTGTVSSTEGAERRDQLRVRCVCNALPLVITTICQTWENESPEAVIAWAVRQSGLPVGQIDSTGVKLRHVVASTVSVWQLARQVARSAEQAHGLDMSHWALWLGADGVHWGDHDEDGSMPEIATAAGLIRHIPSAAPHSMGEVETFLLPDMLHSHKFLLQDTRRGIDDQFRALRVLHEITPTSARTRLGYGEEYGRY